MTFTRRRERGVIGVVALAGLLLLTACAPVASMGRSPDGPTATSTSTPSLGSLRRVVDAACSSDPSEPGAAVSVPADRIRPFATLPSGSFTGAVAAATGQVVQLPAAGVALHDFVPAGGTFDGGVLGPSALGMIGSGSSTTTVSLVPNTSTRASDVPRVFPQTNQLSVLRVAGGARVLQGFTVRGTPQGHLYNGLRIDGVVGLRAADIRVVGIPGDSSRPPGETFGLNDYKTSGSEYARVEVDGAGIGGAGFGVNGSRDIRICDTSSHGNGSSHGFAFWQTNGIKLIDCSADDNGFSGFNFERVSGTVTLVRPEAHGNRFAMRIASDQASAKVTIIDPHLTDGYWTVTLPRTFYGAANRQRRSDITLIIDGHPRPDLLRFQTS
ncbi:MAG: hypothetical protein HIU86_13500 [Acidobacteria bacterium]|nr:hypothetical protein [Acidobacteriota bacterium]